MPYLFLPNICLQPMVGSYLDWSWPLVSIAVGKKSICWYHLQNACSLNHATTLKASTSSEVWEQENERAVLAQQSTGQVLYPFFICMFLSAKIIPFFSHNDGVDHSITKIVLWQYSFMFWLAETLTIHFQHKWIMPHSQYANIVQARRVFSLIPKEIVLACNDDKTMFLPGCQFRC